VYLSGKPACWFEEPRRWLLQTIHCKVLQNCERNYRDAPDTDPSKRRWLNVWRATKATFDSFLTEDDEALEHLGKIASDVLHQIEAKHRTPDGCHSSINLESIDMRSEHRFGDVPSVAAWGAEINGYLLVNTLRNHLLRQGEWYGDPVEPYEWDPSFGAERFADMAPGFVSELNDAFVARPGKPRKPLVPENRARFIATKGELDPEVRASLMIDFAKWREKLATGRKWRDERLAVGVTADSIVELVKAMLRSLGARDVAVQNIFRRSYQREVMADRRAASGESP
jgi:hypothetical protein